MKIARLRALIAAYKKRWILISWLVGYPSELLSVEGTIDGGGWKDEDNIDELSLLRLFAKFDPNASSAALKFIKAEIGTADFVALIEYIIQSKHTITYDVYHKTQALPDADLKNILNILKQCQFTSDDYELYITMNRLRPIDSINTCLAILSPSQQQTLLRQKTPHLLDYLLIVAKEPDHFERELIVAKAFALYEEDKEDSDFSMERLLATIEANNIKIDETLLIKLFGSYFDFSKLLAHNLSVLAEFKLDTTPNIQSITRLAEKKLKRLSVVLAFLKEKKQLDEFTFNKALDDITFKLAPVLESKAVIQTGTRNHATLDGNVEFYIAQDSPMVGGYGTVRRAFTSETSTQPIYAVKHIHGTASASAPKREAKYNHSLLGRQAFFYDDNIVYAWQEGITLKDEKGLTNQLLALSEIDRIKCLRVFFGELNSLHQVFRIHGDIKRTNVILNVAALSLRVIDLGSARKILSPKAGRIGFTYCMFDGQANKWNQEFCDDIYAAGLIAAVMFPELYEIDDTTSDDLLHARLVKTNLSSFDESIVTMVNSMRNPLRQERCCSANLVVYCDELLKHASQLNDETLKHLATILNHEPSSYEEITHQAICAS